MEGNIDQNKINDQMSNNEVSMEDHTDQRNDNAEARNSFCFWKPPPKSIIFITELLE